MNKAIILSFVLSIGIKPLIWAEENTDALSLSHVIAIANQNNPEIESYRQKWLAAQFAISKSRSFPDPVAQFVKFTDELQTRGGPVEEKYSISQKIPFLGKRGLAGSVAKEDAIIVEQAYKSKSLEIFSNVTGAYYELFYIDKSLLINEELADQVRRFSRVAERKYSIGKSYQANVLRANVELAKILNDVTTLKQKRVSALARLNALLNRPPRENVIPLEPTEFKFHFTVEDLEKIALENRPEIAAAQALVNRSEAQRSLAVRQFFPDLVLSYEVTKIGSGTSTTRFDGKDAKAIGFKVNLPIWVNRLSPGVKEAQAHQAASESMLKDWKNKTLYDVADLATRAETAGRLVKLYENNVLPQANEALKSSQRGYESDHISFLELLDSIRMLLKMQLEYRRSQATFVQTRAKLERVLGLSLTEINQNTGGKNEK